MFDWCCLESECHWSVIVSTSNIHLWVSCQKAFSIGISRFPRGFLIFFHGFLLRLCAEQLRAKANHWQITGSSAVPVPTELATEMVVRHPSPANVDETAKALRKSPWRLKCLGKWRWTLSLKFTPVFSFRFLPTYKPCVGYDILCFCRGSLYWVDQPCPLSSWGWYNL